MQKTAEGEDIYGYADSYSFPADTSAYFKEAF